LVVGPRVEPDIQDAKQDIQDNQACSDEQYSEETQGGDVHEGIRIKTRKVSADEDEDEIDQGVEQPGADLLKTYGEGAFVEVPVNNDCHGDDGMQKFIDYPLLAFGLPEMAQCYLVNETDDRYVAGDGCEGAGRTEQSTAAVSLDEHRGKIKGDEDIGEDSEITEEPCSRFQDIDDAIVQHQKILRDDAVPSGER